MTTRQAAVIGFAAYSGTGKTTLLSGIIPLLLNRGLRIGVIKHAHHNFLIDTPGKDSYEFRKAGAEQVLIASKSRVAWIKERSGEQAEPRLRDLLGHYADQQLDLIIVEGFKDEPFPKIEVYRSGRRGPLLSRSDRHVIAVATDCPDSVDVDVVTLDLNDYGQICEFIVQRINCGDLEFPGSAL